MRTLPEPKGNKRNEREQIKFPNLDLRYDNKTGDVLFYSPRNETLVLYTFNVGYKETDFDALEDVKNKYLTTIKSELLRIGYILKR